jgi:hypothetical protein
MLLLGGRDDVLGGLGHAELDHGLGLDLDGCAGLGVAADAGLALCLYEAADAGDNEDAVLLGFLDGLLVISSFSARCRTRAVLVSPVAIECSPSWRALGAAFVDGLPPLDAYRMEGVRKDDLSKKPLYSCGFEEPCRWLQCGLEAGKVNRKSLISTVLLGFDRISPIFGRILLVFSEI